MLTDVHYLALRLEGPFQSWGFDSNYNRRNTGLMPTKSAIAGICCAAIGYNRGCKEELTFLSDFIKVHMTCIAIPLQCRDKNLNVRRLQDYHTVQDTVTAEGKTKPSHITYRQYLSDACFGVLLEGNSVFLNLISKALENPVWGIWLGRKNCIPSAPVLAGLKDTKEGALRLLIGDSTLEMFTHQEDVENFVEGRDSLPDSPVSFAIDKRTFSTRRVKLTYAK